MTNADEFKVFLPLSKVKKESDGSRTVMGYATTEALDLDGEIVTKAAVRNALPAYMEWRNIRQMHQPIAVGVAKEANMDDEGLYLTSKIIDKNCIELLDGDVLKGYSIGGRKLKKVGNKITEIELIEISLVDRPANPDCRIEVQKAAKPVAAEPEAKLPEFLTGDEELQPEERSTLKKFFSAMAKLITPEVKELTDDEWLAAQLADVASAEDYSQIVTAAPASVIGKLSGNDMLAKVFGQLMDLEKREFSQKEREESAESGAAMPDGSFPIKSKKDVENAVLAHGRAKDKAKAKAHIVSRAKIVPGGEAALPDEWKPKGKTETKKSVVFDLEETDGDDLAKNMSSVRCLADAFDCIQNAKRQMLIEGNVEGDLQDKELADRVAAISKDLAGIIGRKAEQEGEEAVALEDADDLWLRYVLNPNQGALKMTKALTTEETEALAKRKASMHKQSVMKAKVHLEKAMTHQAHGMAALAKCAGLMSASQKAATALKPDALAAELAKAVTAFEKMSDEQDVSAYNLAKAASVWGTGYGLPNAAGGSISTLTQEEMTEGEVPEYEADEPYEGKAAGVGAVSEAVLAQIVELAAKAAKAEGKLEGLEGIKDLLSKMPGGPAKARVFSLDKTFFGGEAAVTEGSKELTPMQKMLDGVEMPNQDDQDAVQRAGAKMIANMIGDSLSGGNTFGKSPFHDPNFRGQAQRKAA